MYEWNTIDGRFKVATDIAKLDRLGKKDEATKLRETLGEAFAVYNDPEYYVLKGDKKLLFLYGRRDGWNENAFDKYVKKHIDDYVCHVHCGSTWMQGLICQQCEPTITTKHFEKWRVFETEDGNLWFEKM